MADLRATDNLNDYMENNLRNGEQYATFADFENAVDLSVWDMATACASCHVGGGLVEFDRTGKRLSMRMLDGQQPLNAYDWYVWEMFDPATGGPRHYDGQFGANMPYTLDATGNPVPAAIQPGFGPAMAPWSMPATTDFKPLKADRSNAVMAPSGWVQAGNPYINLGMAVEGQAMMPNVREMDCLFCHMEGYNNIVSSVATQMGYLMAAPALGSGLMNMFTFAYDANKIDVVDFTPMPGMRVAYLKGDMLAKIKAEPPADNCRQCHIPSTMANFSDMFDKFLAAAPMSYNPVSPNASAINSLVMPSYDLNSPFILPGVLSPSVYLNPTTSTWWFYGDGTAANGPYGIFPMALNMGIDIMGTAMAGQPVGGGNPGQMGPLFYDGMDAQTGAMDQNALKKGIIPFPRADFFKRGDNWDGTQDDVHYGIGCGGCHFNTNVANADVNQCDPGRGFSFMGGIENGNNPDGIDTRSTVKRCQDCHVTGTNFEGRPINTYNAPNPDAAHARAGLLASQVQAVKLDASGNEVGFIGNHLDIMSCQTCHVLKGHMAVRSLDSTSGNRYPSIIGIQNQYGMMSMFTDPMPDHSMQFDPVEWQPLYTWDEREQKFKNGAVNPDWRREINPVNMITAVLWDDTNGVEDLNHDGAEGKILDIRWDPAIQRDMKAGMNFAPGPFATIPVGFGAGSYQSAYDASFNFTGAFDFIGIYGGNAMLTNANEIAAYKASRVATRGLNGNNNKDWSATELVIYGGNPFQIEHGVATVSKKALGRTGCSDCHSPTSGFFSGGYNMVGTAIPAAANPFDPDGPGPAPAGDYNMMQRPAVDFNYTGYLGDLRTGAEAKSKKDGSVLEVTFEEHGIWDSATKTFTPAQTGANALRTTDLSRSEYLYPTPHGVAWDAYYGYASGGTDLNGKTFTSLTERIAYLESIGQPPVANVSYVSTTDVVDGGTTDSVSAATLTSAVTITQGQTIYLKALPGGTESYTYTWTASDGGAAIASGRETSRTFTTTGTFQLILTVTNSRGQSALDTIYVKVVAPVAASPVSWVDIADGNNFSGNLLATGLPAHDKITVTWNDYTAVTTSLGTADHTVPHTFLALSSRLVDTNSDGIKDTYRYPVVVRVYNGTALVKSLTLYVNIAKP